MESKTTRWTLQTLSVQETPPDNPYAITIKTDSVWTDQDPSSSGGGTGMMRMGGGQGRSGMSYSRSSGRGRSREQSYKMNPDGRSATKDPIISPYLVPLPEKPITINESWDFEMIVEIKGRSKGQTTVKGKCLLYDVQEEDGKSIALILINSETKMESKFNFETEQGNISGSSSSSGSGTNLVYFDIDKGYITEIIKEEITESVSETSMGSMPRSSSSKSIIKLISK